ncbi:MAG: hypothetical protein ACREK3_00795, partial [Gemmatimonadota bacterium]
IDGNVFDSYEMSIPEEERKTYQRETVPLTMPGPEQPAEEPEGEFVPETAPATEPATATPR